MRPSQAAWILSVSVDAVTVWAGGRTGRVETMSSNAVRLLVVPAVQPRQIDHLIDQLQQRRVVGRVDAVGGRHCRGNVVTGLAPLRDLVRDEDVPVERIVIDEVLEVAAQIGYVFGEG